jgi:DNA-binding NarL/FixJ family response regulator
MNTLSVAILIIDDHEMILRGMAATLTEEIPGSEVAFARSAAEALAASATGRRHCNGP